MYNRKALKQYQQVDVTSSIEDASPHQLILMLLKGVLTAVARAKGLIEQNDYQGKGQQISKASQIIVHLKASLDHQQGGEISANLDGIYDYSLRRLMEANRDMDVAGLDEVAALISEIKAGWEAMPVSE